MKTNCRTTLCRATYLAALVTVSLTSSAFAQTTAVDPVAADSIVVETFTPPKVTKTVNPYYPKANIRQGKEGWVTMSYMVDPNGKAYDVTIISSSGDSAFEKSAVRAAQKWEHEPAILSGKKIDAGITRSITFHLEGATGATRRFIKLQQKALKAIEAKDKVVADDLISTLAKRERNLYEEAYYQLARYLYALEWGDLKSRYNALRQAVFMDNRRGFLPDKVLTGLLFNKMSVELELNYLAQAKKTGTTLLSRKLEDWQTQHIDKAISAINEAKIKPGTLSVAGKIGNSNKFSHRLLKSSFSFDQVEGELAEIRLHCDKDYVGFVYQEDTRFTVREDLNDCFMTVIGNPGTLFKLVES